MSFFKKLFGSSKKKDISSTNDDTLKDDNLIDKSKPPINKKKSNTKKQVVEKDFFKENQTDIKQGKFDKNASFVNKSSDLKKEKVSKKKSIYKKEVVLNKPSENKIIDKQNKKSIFSNFFSKQKKQSLDKGLEKTSSSFFNKISKVIVGKSKVDDEVLDELEEILISSDVGVKTTLKIIDRIESRVSRDKYIGSNELDIILKEEIMGVIDSVEENQFIISNKKPHVILVVGVNGVGKTTSIGKMANHYKSLGLKVIIGASDTFRAAAIEQLEIWAKRVDVDLIKQEMGSDPASVAFDTLESAINKNADVVLIDTAGRLHNKVNLMNELGKIKRVLQKKNIDAPHEVILVIDGSTGQNAFEQAKQFSNVTEITSLVVTKLDGTAKGGVVLGISDQFKIPIKFIGIGEGLEDLQLFNKKEFVNSFFNKSKKY